MAKGIVLIGYRGSGKTTVGRLLAQRLDRAFIDTDELIVHFAGRSIRDIFDGEGEGGFRGRERQAVQMATAAPGRVISVGGGAVESQGNRRRFRNYGTVVWREAPPDTLWNRIQLDAETGSNRPNLTSGGLAEVREVLARRNPLYAETAHVVVRVTDRTPDQVVEDIEAWLAAVDAEP